MPVVWGLDLKEIHWNKFKSSYMWNTDYHLRRTKFIVYQLAMITCVVSESLGTAALSDYLDEQDWFAARNPRAYVYNNDFIGIASFNIFAGVYVATIFGAAFFFDLIWPERRESAGVKLAWKICSVLGVVMVFADVLALTIIVASHGAYVTGVSYATASALFAEYDGPPLLYRHNGRCVAAVVFLWLGLPSTIWACIVMWMSLKHDAEKGPLSTHARAERAIKLVDVDQDSIEHGTPDPDAQRTESWGSLHYQQRLKADVAARETGAYEGT